MNSISPHFHGCLAPESCEKVDQVTTSKALEPAVKPSALLSTRMKVRRLIWRHHARLTSTVALLVSNVKGVQARS